MTQLVINLSRVTQQVGIIDDQGRKTSFRLMARGRVETGYEIDPRWIALNPGAIKVVAITPPVVATPAAQTSSKAKATAATVVASVPVETTSAEGAK